MSAYMTPILSGAIPSFELFMTQWEKLGDEHLLIWRPGQISVWSGPSNTTNEWMIPTLMWSPCVSFCAITDFIFFWILDAVINPCIRFSWFEEEWDNHYINQAKTTILKVVSKDKCLEYVVINVFHADETIPWQTNSSCSPTSPCFPRQTTTGIYEGHVQISAEGKAKSCRRSKSEHWRGSGSLSQPDTNLIQFWEVCVWNHCDVLFTLFDSNSYIKRNILDYMQLHWITSPFRHYLFHASTSSHQLAKRIRRNGTDFHPNWWRPSKCWNSSTRRNGSVSHISSHPLPNALRWTTLLNLEICSTQIRRLRWRQQTASSAFVH